MSQSLCDTFETQRAEDVVATVFAAYRAPNGTAHLMYALDNVSTRVPIILRTMPKWQVDVSCGEHGRHRAALKAHCECAYASWGMCHVITDASACSSPSRLTVSWPRLGLEIGLQLCDTRRHAVLETTALASPRAAEVQACAPVYLSPDQIASRATLQMASMWIERMTAQVGQLHLHAQNRAAEVLGAMNAVAPSLLESRKLVVHPWDWVESTERALGVSLSSQAHLLLRGQTAQDGGLNAKHTTLWTWSKCLLEQRDSTQWMMVMDIDEFFAAAPEAPPAMTLGSFLSALPPSRAQWHFCQPLANNSSRMKSALRLSSGCTWWGFFHYGVPASISKRDRQCWSRDDSGKRFRDIWQHFRSGPGCSAERRRYTIEHNSLRNFIAHQRRTDHGGMSMYHAPRSITAESSQSAPPHALPPVR